MTDIKQRIESLKKSAKINKEATAQKKIGPLHVMIDLASGMAVGCGIGYYLDQYFGTLPAFLFICSILGVAGGFYNFFKSY